MTPKLKPEHAAYLRQFAGTRRMKRDADKTAKRPDPVREKAKLPVGDEGGFFVGETGSCGQDHSEDIVEYNQPPAGQPGLWCQWTPTKNGDGIEWDNGEKFYYYVEWIKYLIKHFLAPWGYTLHGEVEWVGEDPDDRGLIRIGENKVKILKARIEYEEEDEEEGE